jgi:thiol:disulfide interchange protein DsbA
MNFKIFFSKLLFVCIPNVVMCPAFSAVGSGLDTPLPKVGYVEVSTQSTLTTEGKTEVIEFFSYLCPHCNAIEDTLNDWVKSQGAKIVFRRVPVAFYPSMVPSQKFYYSLLFMGFEDRYRSNVFDFSMSDHQALANDARIFSLVQKFELNQIAFRKSFASLDVTNGIRNADVLRKQSKVREIPAILINRRYLISPSLTASASEKKGWFAARFLSASSERQVQSEMLNVVDQITKKETALAKVRKP